MLNWHPVTEPFGTQTGRSRQFLADWSFSHKNSKQNMFHFPCKLSSNQNLRFASSLFSPWRVIGLAKCVMWTINKSFFGTQRIQKIADRPIDLIVWKSYRRRYEYHLRLEFTDKKLNSTGELNPWWKWIFVRIHSLGWVESMSDKLPTEPRKLVNG